jgi:hypothetical protein
VGARLPAPQDVDGGAEGTAGGAAGEEIGGGACAQKALDEGFNAWKTKNFYSE